MRGQPAFTRESESSPSASSWRHIPGDKSRGAGGKEVCAVPRMMGSSAAANLFDDARDLTAGSHRQAGRGSIRGSPNCGKTLLSATQVIAETQSPSSVRTSSSVPPRDLGQGSGSSNRKRAGHWRGSARRRQEKPSARPSPPAASRVRSPRMAAAATCVRGAGPPSDAPAPRPAAPGSRRGGRPRGRTPASAHTRWSARRSDSPGA